MIKGKIPLSMRKHKISQQDVKFLKSLNAAVLQKNPVRMSMVLYIIAAVVFAFIIWANVAEVDELTRGMGRVIPSRQIQVIQKQDNNK